jgi:hypothetical protein
MKKLALLLGTSLAAAGTVLSLLVVLTATSSHCPFGFDFGMTVIAPGATVGEAFGLQYGEAPWLWGILVVLVNALLCFALGAGVGAAIYRLAKTSIRTHETSG